MKNAIIKFIRDEKGATAIEYGIIAGLMAVVLITIFGTNGSLAVALTNTFGKIVTALTTGA
jgi:pilus assembly protein Flp/PilA